jgi:trigger factor
MNQSLSSQGLGLQQYLEWTGKTVDELREETRPEAEKRIRTRILLKNVIRMEGLEVEDEEIRELMEDFGKQYGMTVDQVKEMAGSETENYFREDAQTKKAIEWLFEHAKVVEKKAPKKTKAKKEAKKEEKAEEK